MEEEKIRLFVGGLAPEVSAGDLQERFAPLGNVEKITLPSAKAGGSGHRGFAYVDFVPATDASLRKLFSAYNGCKWRGGVLRIEKAKEHYTEKLHREWAIEAASSTTDPPANQVDVAQKSPSTSVWQMRVNGVEGDTEDSDLKIFFPRLRKLKSVPLRGLGKHKRSFQRVESSPLKSLISCACEESLRTGSCTCSNINGDNSSLKQNTGCESDEIAQAIEIERQRQLELLNRLFPSDSTSISLENQQVVELDDDQEKGILPHEGTGGSTEETFSKETSLPPSAEMVNQDGPNHLLQRSGAESVVGRRQTEDLNSKMDSENWENGIEDDSTSIANERAKQLELMHRLFPADASSPREPEKVLEPEVAKVKKKRKLGASGKVLNLGDDSLPFAIAEEQEKHEMKNLSVRADELLEKASEMSRHVRDDALSLANAEVRERQREESPQIVISEDELEDSEMALNLGDDSAPLSKAEDEERALVRMLPTWDLDEAKHYDGTTTDGFSDLEEFEEAEASGTEESSSEEQEYSEGVSDTEEVDEAVDSEIAELSSEEQDYSENSSDSGEAHEGEDSEDKEYFSSEEEDDSLHDEENSEPIALTKRTESNLTKDSLLRDKGESGGAGKQPEESSKWASLAEMCQFRTQGGLQSEESKLETNSKPVTTSNKDEDVPSTQLAGFQVVEGNTTSQQPTEAEKHTENPDNSSSAGQKLTRDAWRSLVGETGRVVFSLSQLTGSSLLPQAPSVIQETQVFEDAYTQVEPSVSFKASSQNQAKSKLAVRTAEKRHDGIKSSAEPNVNAAELANTSVSRLFSSSDVCPFMRSENAEEEWLATRSELRSDYRAKQKYAARNVKKLWGRR